MTKAEQIRAAELLLRVAKPLVHVVGRMARPLHRVDTIVTCLYLDLEDWVKDNK
ncbi:hypothetical protein [Mycobacterium sp. IS-3022]|uniref:hypothetical protein n=1 Tax=Mycobacterium sp. IS-3022 TaxID=1772277 RepID=UPI000AECB571|nr:hypothetical protein [Mycobacterium sp. IS-3022]